MTHPVLDENETHQGLSMDAEAVVSVPVENNDSEMFSDFWPSFPVQKYINICT
jgi:hypothetical protein